MSKSGPKPFRTNIKDVPLVPGLKKEDGWVDMKVQFLIDEKTANSGRMLVGWTVLPPGAAHEHHRHANVDEFWIVIKGNGVMYTDEGEEASGEGDVVFTPAGHWHGFKNTSDEDVVLAWGWSGAGSLEGAGYEVPDSSERA
ncbi:MAG: cupin domain-containing protein [Gammaproteobacteria bacterium]|nr:cupin domain-containing protein [Gammaproteobacteria bacterium]MDH4255455.1 cupin domain-containing protein [Gammaproteobacteria bacterium]MDH5310568.1 cupin domain-containing protein [Gammaproteobacteria bacterium]